MNIAICSVLLKSFCGPFIHELEANYPSPSDKIEGVRNAASDAGNDEIVSICDYIEEKGLVETFFPK